jgi:hypothetical protein
MARQTEGLSTRMTQWLIVTEAALLLTSARIALWLAPFQQLMAVLSRPTAQVDLSESERSETRQAVRQGILAARRYLPFPTTCLHRAIAAHWMLRRRGVDATLYYGVTRSGGKLTGPRLGAGRRCRRDRAAGNPAAAISCGCTLSAAIVISFIVHPSIQRSIP